jgi:hypothetical protein
MPYGLLAPKATYTTTWSGSPGREEKTTSRRVPPVLCGP